jgi:hypothetical protein
MTPEMQGRHHQKTLREFYEATGDKSAVWINDETGQIVDSLAVESRVPPGSGGCYAISSSHQPEIERRRRSIDLVGRAPDQQHAVTAVVRKNPAPMLPAPHRLLLLGRRGGP